MLWDWQTGCSTSDTDHHPGGTEPELYSQICHCVDVSAAVDRELGNRNHRRMIVRSSGDFLKTRALGFVATDAEIL